MRRMFAIGAALAMSFASVALADEIECKNGDKVTGIISEVDAKKATVKTDNFGDVSVDVANIKTMSTRDPVRVKMSDGTMKSERLSAGADGTVKVGAEQVPFANIAKISSTAVKWTGRVGIAGVFNRGNSYNDGFASRLNAVRRSDLDRTTFLAGFDWARQKSGGLDATTTKEYYFAEGKYDWFMNDKTYLFGDLRVEKDRIANIDWYVRPSVGIGYQFIETDDLAFSGEAGLGWNNYMYHIVPDGTDDSKDYFSGYLAYHLTGKLNPRLGYAHNLTYLPSLENGRDFQVNTDAILVYKLTANMDAGLGVELRHNSSPAEGALKNDVQYKISVGWSF